MIGMSVFEIQYLATTEFMDFLVQNLVIRRNKCTIVY